MCPSLRGYSPSPDELKNAMANRSETELRAILEANPSEYTIEAYEAARVEWTNRGLTLDPEPVCMASEVSIPSVQRKTRVLGRNDIIGCAIFSVLVLASNRNSTLGTSGAEWGSLLIGYFVGILVLWALLKGGFLFVRNFIRGLRGN